MEQGGEGALQLAHWFCVRCRWGAWGGGEGVKGCRGRRDASLTSASSFSSAVFCPVACSFFTFT